MINFRVSSDDLAPLSQELLSSLFATLDKPVSEENEYIMKGIFFSVYIIYLLNLIFLAIMRVLSTLQDKIIVFMADALPKLTEKLHQVAKNPSKPLFNHYLFETFSICIRYVCQKDPSATASFENILFPIFQGILQQDIQGNFWKMIQIDVTIKKNFRIHSLCIPTVIVINGINTSGKY